MYQCTYKMDLNSDNNDEDSRGAAVRTRSGSGVSSSTNTCYNRHSTINNSDCSNYCESIEGRLGAPVKMRPLRAGTRGFRKDMLSSFDNDHDDDTRRMVDIEIDHKKKRKFKRRLAVNSHDMLLLDDQQQQQQQIMSSRRRRIISNSLSLSLSSSAYKNLNISNSLRRIKLPNVLITTTLVLFSLYLMKSPSPSTAHNKPILLFAESHELQQPEQSLQSQQEQQLQLQQLQQLQEIVRQQQKSAYQQLQQRQHQQQHSQVSPDPLDVATGELLSLPSSSSSQQQQQQQWFGPEQSQGAWLPAAAPEVVRDNQRAQPEASEGSPVGEAVSVDEASSAFGGFSEDHLQPIAPIHKVQSRAGESAASAGVNYPSAGQSSLMMQPTADFFGSRRLPEAQPIAASERIDSTSQLAAGTVADNQFSSRQGQLAPTSGDQQQQAASGNRRPLQQRQQQQPMRNANQNTNLSGQQQANSRARLQRGQLPANLASAQSNLVEQSVPSSQAAGVDLQPRFQRLRTPPGGSATGDQFQPMGPNGPQQQPQSPAQLLQFVQQQQQQQQNARLNNNNNGQFGAPTLSAFDLSSLANLANQAQFGQQSQPTGNINNNNNNNNNQASASASRRIPPQPLPQQQPQNNLQQRQQQSNQVPNVGQQQANSNGFSPSQGPPFASSSSGGQTELPFIRQVFRPSGEEAQQPGSSAGGDERGSRPTPPPLFVPARPINKVTRLMESGFSPVQMPPLGAPTGSREVFFEPASGAQSGPASSRPNQRVRQPASGLSQTAAAATAPPVEPVPVQPVPSLTTSQPSVANNRQVVNANEPAQIPQARKPPVRRPSQRPQLPVAATLPTQAASQRPQSNLQQAQATTVPTDVIRLAANAIQTANEGLAALAFTTSQQPPAPGLAVASSSSNGQQPAGDQQQTTPSLADPSPARQSSAPITTTTIGQQQATTQAGPVQGQESAIVTTTPSTSGELASGSRRGSQAPQVPLRTSANFFTLTSTATTSPSASSFSPALPINAAVAASGGRRRIPVRSQTSSSQAQGSRGAQSAPSPTTTTMASGSASPALSVRRPEIEEFYETISGSNGAGLNAATTIDGFGAPSRGQPAAAPVAQPSAPTTTGEGLLGTTIAQKDPDFYGSRLNSGQPTGGQDAPGSPTGQPEPTGSGGQRQPQEPASNTGEPTQASRQVGRSQQQQAAASNQEQGGQIAPASQQPVMVPITYMTTLTYLTTVLYGTHTLETWHESVVKSTELATLNAQLMDQIEHKLPLIQPTATVGLSSKTKGKGTTIINLKSAVSAYNQELVEALGVNQPAGDQIRPSATLPSVILQTASPLNGVAGQQPEVPAASSRTNKFRAPTRNNNLQQAQAQRPLVRGSRTLELSELQEAKKSLLTEFVYLYTMRPLDPLAGSNQIETTSVRSEIISGATDLAGQEQLMSQLALMASGPNVPTIDSKGMMRIGAAAQEAQPAPINLGSTIGKDQATMTEVNMNVATYIKFDDITNAIVELRPTRLAADPSQPDAGDQLQRLPAANSRLPQLDASFSPHLTLSEALDKLQSSPPASGQQTPALDPLATRPKVDELLRSTAAVDSSRLSSSVAGSQLARSQLRSRVASSRFRGAPLQPQQSSQLQLLTPAAAPARQPNPLSSSPVASPSLAPAPASAIAQASAAAATTSAAGSSSVAPSVAASRSQRPMKSRLARPSTRPAQNEPELLGSPTLPSVAGSASQSPTASVSRATKPRFVVVTRTGQFGIRASAMSSMASLASQSAASAAAAAELAAASTAAASEAPIKPSSVSGVQQAAPESTSQLSTNRVTSRFSKPNRFRGASSSLRQPSSQDISATPALPMPSVATSAPVPSPQPPATKEPESSAASSSTASGAPASPTSPAPEPEAQPAGSDRSVDTSAAAADNAASVIVTYFTTTTHTIPFTIDSQTIFTTMEETNSRVATEFMRDLGGHFIEPTPVVSQPQATQLQSPQASNGPSGGQQEASSPTNQQPPTTQSPPSPPPTTTTTSGAADAANQRQADSSAAPPPTTNNPLTSANLEPSFVVSVNTRTYFTTFTYFTTYSAGQATPTVKSSESTTSNVLTETVTSAFEPSKTVALDLQPTASLSRPEPIGASISNSIGEMPMLVSQSANLPPGPASSATVASGQEPDATSSSQQPTPPLESSTNADLTIKTMLNTMTYYGTVYNGNQTSLTPILDVSTEVLTFSSGGLYTSPSLADISSSPSAQIRSTPTTGSMEMQTQQPMVATIMPAAEPTSVAQDNSDKITRTRSLYTTLTHYITFYSGTKTQLSTIQEISPTVVTEYLDRTQFEMQQQQQQQQQQAESSGQSAQQPEMTSMSSVVQMTPSPVLPVSAEPTASIGVDQSSSGQEPAQPVAAGSSPSATVATTSQQQQDDREWASSSGKSSPSTTPAASSTPPTTTIRDTTTQSGPDQTSGSPGELDSVQVSKPRGPQADNQSLEGRQEQPRVLASSEQSSGSQAGEQQQTSSTNIIELSDLIGASNHSQSGRVALAGNLGAAIKDIVQLLAGNKTNTMPPPLPGLPTTPTEAATEQQAPTTTTASTTTTTTTTTAATSTTAAAGPNKLRGAPTRLYGQKAKEQQLLSLQGSISSPASSSTTSGDFAGQQQSASASSSRVATPELASASSRGQQQQQAASSEPSNQQQQQQQQQQPGAAATIFFGDDGGDERKKQIKTVWPAAAQSTLYVTSIEPSTRSLTLTTTKVYYTRDAPLTITSSFTTLIAPRTFVSTIMGTRTLVNQLSTQQMQLPSVQQQPQQPVAVEQPKPAVPKQAAPSRQDSQAAGHRLSVQQKQQKQQEQLQRKQQLQQQQQQQQAATAASSSKPRLTTRPVPAQGASEQQVGANINQCQPACKISNNEICRFHPASETSGAQGTFACACRPGYHTVVNSVGQRQCHEVQSYVVLLRLLQVGDQQVSFKKELQDKSSAEYKQFSRLVKDHVKRAYLTSELTKDRFVNADVMNYARSLGIQPALNSISAAPQPTAGRQPVAFNASQMDPLNAGVIVNITVQMQPPTSANELLDEATLKEELTKKLNLRQAAALAAAAQAAATKTTSSAETPTSETTADTVGAGTSAGNGSQPQPMDEMLPNPNALFLADVEQVSDLDECANPALNDCHESAACINEAGSYKCDCREYPDLNPLHPGRQCANELKSCDYCNNRGDCLRVPSIHSTSISAAGATTFNSSASSGSGSGFRSPGFSTVCQCHRFYLGRRCEINGLMLACLLPIVTILLFVSVCLVIYCCRRWRKRSALSKGFRNIGTFGPNMIGGTLDRKAMLESSSESSDTHQRSHHLRAAANGIYDTTGGIPSDPPSSSNESSPRQMVRNQMVDGGLLQSGSGYHLSPHLVDTRQQQTSQQQQLNPSLGPYSSSIPPQIVIPRARHNQVNYAVHRGQVYMW